jgi:hypothetical protein
MCKRSGWRSFERDVAWRMTGSVPRLLAHRSGGAKGSAKYIVAQMYVETCDTGVVQVSKAEFQFDPIA